MYPDLKFFLENLFGTEMPAFLSFIKTFGFFVAISFIVAAYLLKAELKRKEALCLFKPNLLPRDKARRYLQKENRDHASKELMPVFPHQRVGDIVFIAVLGGFIGAKLFNALETWEQFVVDPLGSLISGGGLTFYGGLIVATVMIFLYCKRHSISIAHLCDAIAPALMIAYAIGRLGCHFSGDGDWGIFNSAYISLPDASIESASAAQFDSAVQKSASYFAENFGNLKIIPNSPVKADNENLRWMYAMNYAHNVNNEGVPIAGCSGNYCQMLPVPVFPTSIYESVICIVLFGFLWVIRRKTWKPLTLFAIYLILNGLERFLIEKIKVNYEYDWGFIHPAQSEIIAVVLIITGLFIVVRNNINPLKK